MDWMIQAKKRGHSIYEVQRNLEYVENVQMLSSLYGDAKEELLAIAIRQDQKALIKFFVNHPEFDYFPRKEANTSSLVHFLAKNGGVKLMKLFLSILPSEKDKRDILNFPGKDGLTPFMLAARNNKIQMIQVTLFLSFFPLISQEKTQIVFIVEESRRFGKRSPRVFSSLFHKFPLN